MLPHRPPIPILIAVTGLAPLALNIFLPSMPGLQVHFATDYGTVQLALTLYLVAMAGGQLLLGPLSDRFGRRPILLGGLACFVAGSLAAAAATSIGVLVAARIVQAAGGAAGVVMGRAIVRDVHGRERSASVLAYVTMAMVVVPMMAPALGGLLDDAWGWQASFVATGLAGVAVLAAVALLVGETHHGHNPLPGLAPLLAGYGALLGSVPFCGYTLVLGFGSAVFFAFLAGAPYVMITLLGRPPSEYGLWFMVASLGYMGGNFVTGRLSIRLGIERMMGLGSAITMAGAAGFALPLFFLPPTPAALFLPQMVIAFGNGLTLPNAMAGAISVNPRAAGAAAGLSGFIQMVMGALVTLLVGHLLGGSALPMALLMLACAGLALLSTRLVPRKGKGEPR